MVVRELKDGSSIVSTQEDHAELSAQFAAHWGNDRFSKLRPYRPMVFATTYHDSGYRDWEGNPPINLAKGRPYGHREGVPGFEEYELEAYLRIIDWLRQRDPYAGLLVSMHRSGLWQNRYDTFTNPGGKSRERSAAVKAVMRDLESRQQEERKSLGQDNLEFEKELWFNYRMLQLFDILSLYFCCDGYADEKLKEDLVAPVPVRYESKDDVNLRLIPVGDRAVKFEPYPFDVSPLTVSVRARKITAGSYRSEEEGKEAYFKAPRFFLSFDVTA